MKDLEQLIRSINLYPADIRAEVILADLIEDGLVPDDFTVFFDSHFRRGYSRDILKAEAFSIDDFKRILAIRLSRDGFYDILPEGMFHPPPDTALSSGKDMANDSRKEIKVEEETRNFFHPIENELFYQRIELELQERRILEKLNDSHFDDFFLRFWQIDQTLPKNLISRLAMMLPFCNTIVGNFKLTASCLANILKEEVHYKIRHTSEVNSDIFSDRDLDEFALGNASLGANLITGSEFIDYSSSIKFIIGPLKRTDVGAYLADGEITSFIDCFCGFFIPVEMEYSYEIVVNKEKQEFIMDSGENQAVMGYSTMI